ncbi:MAG: nucleotidyl transferase AbiEii/AbiGii toxin family protein [Pirellulaceae bacterium]
MKLDFLALPDDERRLYIEQAAIQRSLSPVIMEKDFWVCWLLGILFESKFAGDLVFKGGTSLSKVFGVIDRFSEDIDLSLSPRFLNLPEAGKSRTQANKWMAKAEAVCGQAVKSLIAHCWKPPPLTPLAIAARRGSEFLTDPATHSPVLLFHYPSTQPDGFAYLKRSVKLEFGSLTDQQPTGRHPVAPWIADVLPEAFPDWKCEVVALEVQRTVWEKATILHTEFHRPADKPTRTASRGHYADTAALATHPDASKAAEDHELRSRVVYWKSRFFGSSWAKV